MYATYGNIYHQYTPNVSIYAIHGSYGFGYALDTHGFNGFKAFQNRGFPIVMGVSLKIAVWSLSRKKNPSKNGWCSGVPPWLWKPPYYYWLVVWLPFFTFPYILGLCHHPNWRTPSFFRGVAEPPTILWPLSWYAGWTPWGRQRRFVGILGICSIPSRRIVHGVAEFFSHRIVQECSEAISTIEHLRGHTCGWFPKSWG